VTENLSNSEPRSAREVAASRVHSPHTSMFLRMLVRAAVLRRGRALSALFAMVVAAAVSTAMLNLYVDVQAKLRREFRNYGANIILVGKGGASLPADALPQVESILAGRGVVAPFAMVVARTSDGQAIVVAGTDFDRVKQLDRWWSVPEEIATTMYQLEQAVPSAEVRPVRQIMEGEARVLGKTRSTLLSAAVLIILTAALCVLSTLMGWVFDRRRDFAIMKTLGASDRLLNGFFAAEAAALGAAGAVIGFVLGIGIAAWIGRVNFHAPVVPRFSVLPFVLAGSMVVTLLSAILPIWLLRRVQPAVILRGE
jgi:hypothetical protein